MRGEPARSSESCPDPPMATEGSHSDTRVKGRGREQVMCWARRILPEIDRLPEHRSPAGFRPRW